MKSMVIKRWVKLEIQNSRIQIKITRKMIFDFCKVYHADEAVFEWDGTWWRRIEELSDDWMNDDLPNLEVEPRDLAALDETLIGRMVFVGSEKDGEVIFGYEETKNEN